MSSDVWVSFPHPLDCTRTLCLWLSNCCSRRKPSDTVFLSSPVRWPLVPRLLCAQCVFNPHRAHLVLLPRVRRCCSGSLSSCLFFFVVVARSSAPPWLPPLIVRLSPLSHSLSACSLSALFFLQFCLFGGWFSIVSFFIMSLFCV